MPPALQRAFPDFATAPASRSGRCPGFPIPFLVAPDLGPPELFATFGPVEHRAIVAVPEAAMYPKQRVMLREDQIWLAGKIPALKPEAEPACMQPLADDQLRFGIPSPDCRHIAASGGSVMDISQL